MSHWRRTRMISFRVSEREFEMLKAMSEAKGARSVSDFARVALCGHRNGASIESIEPDETITLLRKEVEDLKVYVRRVAEILEAREPTSPQKPLAAVGRQTEKSHR